MPPHHEQSHVEAIPGLAELADRLGFRLLLQFGSTVRAMQHPRSDLDIAVEFNDSDVPIDTIIELQHALQGLFPDAELDVAIINRADPLFLKKITEQSRLLYGRPQSLARLRLYAFKRYQDHRRFLELERRFVGERLAALSVGSQST